MADKLQNDYEEHDSGGEKGSSQKILLLVLLLLVAVFVYLYFFTSLIRPQATVVTPPVAQIPQVKQPIPPRAGQPVNGQPVSPDAATTAPSAGGKPGVPTAPAVSPKPVPTATAQPANAPPQKEPAKTATPVKAAASVTAKPEHKAAATPPAKAVQAKSVKRASAKTTAAVKTAEKKRVAATDSSRKYTKPALNKIKSVYALNINEDLAASEVQPMLTRLKKAGLTAVALNKATREESMNRLFFAAFDRQNSAQAEASKLQALAPAAFILFENEKYSVYAGSFLREDKATRERDRLFDKGVKLTVNKARVAVPVIKITAGHFSDKNEADSALKRLRKSGISATVIKIGT